MTTYRFGPFRLDEEQRLLEVNGAALPLGPKVIETLLALVERPGRLVSKSELLRRVWPEGFVEEANLAQNIYVLRKALRAHGGLDAIETVPRRGYRFLPEVSAGAAAPQPAPQAAAPPRRWMRGWPAVAVAALAAGLTLAGVVHSAPQAAAASRLSPEGARLFAIGTYYWNQRTASSIAKGLRYFLQVTRTDPGDAQGYAGLALSYAIDADYGFGPLGRRASSSAARAYANDALRRNPRCAQAYAALGLTDLDTHHMERAQAEFRRAIALNPSDAPAHQWYGALLLQRGHVADAFAELQRAANLAPESVAATDWLAQAAYLSRRYRESIQYAHQALDLSPQRYEVYQEIGLAYEALGQYRVAIAAYRKYASSCAQCRDEAAALLAHAYAATHDYSGALAELRVAQHGMALDRVDPEDVVTALVALGKRDEALAMLRRAGHVPFEALLAVDPRMDPVRRDARFRPFTQMPALSS
jgi:DNA-binding winged helix-turn-helix (wHTH) protein/Flp pilus assembly protein TadD